MKDKQIIALIKETTTKKSGKKRTVKIEVDKWLSPVKPHEYKEKEIESNNRLAWFLTQKKKYNCNNFTAVQSPIRETDKQTITKTIKGGNIDDYNLNEIMKR